MAKKKKIKPVTNANLGSDFEAHRKMVGQTLYAKGKSVIKKSKYVVQKDVRTIINEAREAKDALKRTRKNVAKNGIKDLKIDGARLMDMLKGIKVKESPSQSSTTQQLQTIVQTPVVQEPVPVTSSQNKRTERKGTPSYYDKWYDLIYSELRISNLKK